MAKRKSPVRSRRVLKGKSRSKVTSKRRALSSPTRASRALARSTAARKPKAKAPSVSAHATRIRSRAAIKGWETRRRNAAQKLSKKEQRRRTRPQQAMLVEHQASVRYTRKHGASTGHSGTLQGSILAPRGTSASELRQALIDHIKGKTPKFTTSAVEWRRRRA